MGDGWQALEYIGSSGTISLRRLIFMLQGIDGAGEAVSKNSSSLKTNKVYHATRILKVKDSL